MPLHTQTNRGGGLATTAQGGGRYDGRATGRRSYILAETLLQPAAVRSQLLPPAAVVLQILGQPSVIVGNNPDGPIHCPCGNLVIEGRI
jgi:hypothetical protein